MMLENKLFYKYIIVFLIFLDLEIFCTEFKSKTLSRFKTGTMTETNLKSSSKTFSASNLKFQDKITQQPAQNIEIENGVPFGSDNNDINKITVYEKARDWRGWMKYFTVAKGEKAKGFYKNFSFAKQAKEHPEIDLDSKTENIYDYIRDDNSFYVTVLKDNILISSTRNDKFTSIYQAININNILPLDERGEGGIVDIGHHPEGFCLKIITNIKKITAAVPLGITTTDYVFCNEVEKDKTSFLNTLVQLKLKLQQENTVVALPTEKLIKRLPAHSIDSMISANDNEQKLEGDSEDGKWVILKDWSQCSKKCGGGVSTQQRYCVPRVGNGKPCEGDAILKKDCNEAPCNMIIKHFQKKPPQIVNKPDIKIMPFSDRPQRYIKCKIKENDLMMFKNIKNDNKDVVVYQPVRVVMNNATLSIYESSQYTSNELNFDIITSSIRQSTTHPWCFFITERDLEVELCNFISHDKTSNEKFIKEWLRDFDLFKRVCHTGRFTNTVDIIKDEIKEKMKEMNIEIEREKTIKLRNNKEEEKQESIVLTKEKILEIGKAALEKEKMLEKYVLEEKNQLEEKLIVQMKHKLKEEQVREKKLLESTEEEQINEDIAVEDMKKKDEIDHIKALIAKNILSAREDFKHKLAENDKIKTKEIQKINTEILEVRNSIGKEFDNPNKQGSIDKCVRGQDPKYRQDYCVHNYTPAKMRWFFECTQSSFCTACCQNEFGANLKDERISCIKRSCGEEVKFHTN